jgi:hypothetical protein
MLQSLLLRWKIWRLDRKWAASVKRTYKAVEAGRAQNASEQELKEIAGGREYYLWRQRINALQTASEELRYGSAPWCCSRHPT